MKRKLADRPYWSRILKKEYKQVYINDISFCGYITSLALNEPLYVKYDTEELCIVDEGYLWVMHFPDGMNYTITTTIDKQGRIVQWYFDVVQSQGINEDGIPYIDDLYLDLVYLPDGRIFILDEDELEEALSKGLIKQSEYESAYQTLNEIINSLKTNTNSIINNILNHLELLENI
ncbi:DUF402 domain-containing protein [Paenibacillus sp. KN14-4R]|uniref:DUF402 domain-containing protein n=1 Tax=Paenibacillus sp. KN14-4R TaxID=3445773 RepID=UPI003FA01722